MSRIRKAQQAWRLLDLPQPAGYGGRTFTAGGQHLQVRLSTAEQQGDPNQRSVHGGRRGRSFPAVRVVPTRSTIRPGICHQADWS
jgi:hypothetical protein